MSAVAVSEAAAIMSTYCRVDNQLLFNFLIKTRRSRKRRRDDPSLIIRPRCPESQLSPFKSRAIDLVKEHIFLDIKYELTICSVRVGAIEVRAAHYPRAQAFKLA